MVKTNELLKAGWHQESDSQYWWRYPAASASSTHTSGPIEHDDTNVLKVQIGGTMVGIWNALSDDSEDGWEDLSIELGSRSHLGLSIFVRMNSSQLLTEIPSLSGLRLFLCDLSPCCSGGPSSQCRFRSGRYTVGEVNAPALTKDYFVD
jgi:hypothetical protein